LLLSTCDDSVVRNHAPQWSVHAEDIMQTHLTRCRLQYPRTRSGNAIEQSTRPRTKKARRSLPRGEEGVKISPGIRLEITTETMTSLRDQRSEVA